MWGKIEKPLENIEKIQWENFENHKQKYEQTKYSVKILQYSSEKILNISLKNFQEWFIILQILIFNDNICEASVISSRH